MVPHNSLPNCHFCRADKPPAGNGCQSVDRRDAAPEEAWDKRKGLLDDPPQAAHLQIATPVAALL